MVLLRTLYEIPAHIDNPVVVDEFGHLQYKYFLLDARYVNCDIVPAHSSLAPFMLLVDPYCAKKIMVYNVVWTTFLHTLMFNVRSASSVSRIST